MATIRFTRRQIRDIADDSAHELYPKILYMTITREKVVQDGSRYEIQDIGSDRDFRISDVRRFENNGVRVRDYPVWIKVPQANYQDNVPTYLPRATKPDPQNEEQEIPRVWEEWKDSTHEHHLIGTDYYIGGNSANGKDLDSDEIKSLLQDSYELFREDQIQALLNP